MNVWTKRGVDIVAPTDAAGNPRKVVNGEMQTWMTEVERLFNTGAFNSVDAVGLYADRSTFDAEAEGFVYVSIDGNGAGSSSAVAFIKESAASGDWSPPVPFQGDKGWSPMFRAASDGARRVLEVYDWVGGDGEKPATVGFVGAAGLTPNIAEAIDIRGPQGVSGTGLSWKFDDGTADADPGAGNLRADAADLSAATALFVSKASAGGDLLASFLAGLTNSTSTHKGYLIVTDPLTASQATFDVTGTTDAAGYVKLAVSGHSGALAFADAAQLSVVFSRTGNAGDLNGVNPGNAGLAVLGAETASDAVNSIADSNAPASSSARKLFNRLNDKFDLRDFGDITAGDNSVLINSAIDAATAAGGGYVVLPPGTTPISNINMKDRVSLVPSGSGSILQNIGTETYMIEATGSLGTAVSLLTDAAEGDNQIEIADTSGLSAGDWIVITDGYSYASTDAGYKSGESAQVASVDSATQITLVGKLFGSMVSGGSYTVANSAKIQRLSPIIAPVIEDVEIVGSFVEATTAIHISYAVGAKASPYVHDFGNSALFVRGVVDSDFSHGRYDNLRDDVGNGRAGYAICLAGPSLGVRVTGNSMSRCRHGFTTIGGSTGYPHAALISANVGRNTTQTSFDTHNAGDALTFSGNHAVDSEGGGITTRSKNTAIVGNTIEGFESHGITATEGGVSKVTIKANTVDAKRRGAGHGINVSRECPNLSISNNILRNISADGIQLFSRVKTR